MMVLQTKPEKYVTYMHRKITASRSYTNPTGAYLMLVMQASGLLPVNM